MSLLRRIVVVSNKSHLCALAQEIAREVFAADDLVEAAAIVNTVTPDMTVLDETFALDEIAEFLRRTDNGPGPRPISVAAVAQHAPFSDRDYETVGVSHCLRGEQEHQRLREIARQIVAGVQERHRDAADDACFVDELAAAAGIVGRSEAIRKTVEMIRLVARSRCNPILVTGETGTGKELAARAIHAIRHPDKPFVAVNCAALTATLLESELFGHIKGSFTGADRDKVGLLECADEGTLFLDEISEMPLDLQAKLLRVLQERTFRKVGGVKDVACRATIIASSNRNLRTEVDERRFRQDLYYRLNICPIDMAPLRSSERRADIRLLTEHFLRTSTICGHGQTKVSAITPLALEAIERHDWPGNVRELRNVIERAILLETTDRIGLRSIVIETERTQAGPGTSAGRRVRDFSLEKAERELIARALHETGWQKTQAASLLGITRATLYAKVKQYNIQRQRSQQNDSELAPFHAPEPESVAVG
ncbi:MAG: sigma-54-dependent Fis family transcriptional regulator [Sedimentisphaerales bacterium]|nr:sigma-54-dependent Fis family transcriptional regulator [Sedimentisphaerales bacterium]